MGGPYGAIFGFTILRRDAGSQEMSDHGGEEADDAAIFGLRSKEDDGL